MRRRWKMSRSDQPAGVAVDRWVRPLPEQAGWALEMHGALVLFASNAERSRGGSPGATTPIFTAAQMHAYAAAERERIADLWAGCTTEAEGHGLVDIGASIRAGRLVDAA
jgi:hypothetical protein